MNNNKNYIQPKTEVVDFLGSESVMGYTLGEDTTLDQFAKPASDIDPEATEEEPTRSVWDD